MKKRTKGSIEILNLIRAAFVSLSLLFTSSVFKIENKNTDVLGTQLAAAVYCDWNHRNNCGDCGCVPSTSGGHCNYGCNTSPPPPPAVVAPTPIPAPTPTPTSYDPLNVNPLLTPVTCAPCDCSGVIHCSNPANDMSCNPPSSCNTTSNTNTTSTPFCVPYAGECGGGKTCCSGDCELNPYGGGYYCGSATPTPTPYDPLNVNPLLTPVTCAPCDCSGVIHCSNPANDMSCNPPSSCPKPVTIPTTCLTSGQSCNSGTCCSGLVCELTPYGGKSCVSTAGSPCNKGLSYCEAYGASYSIFTCDSAGYYLPTKRCDFGCRGSGCAVGGCLAGQNACTGDLSGVKTCSTDSLNWETRLCQYGCNSSVNACNTAPITSGSTTTPGVGSYSGSNCQARGGSCAGFDSSCRAEFGQADCPAGKKCGIGCTSTISTPTPIVSGSASGGNTQTTLPPGVVISTDPNTGKPMIIANSLQDYSKAYKILCSDPKNNCLDLELIPSHLGGTIKYLKRDAVNGEFIPEATPIPGGMVPTQTASESNLHSLDTDPSFAGHVYIDRKNQKAGVPIPVDVDSSVVEPALDFTTAVSKIRNEETGLVYYAQISSGFRTAAYQASLYANRTASDVAKAGYSQHQTGLAIDVKSDLPKDELRAKANENGFIEPFYKPQYGSDAGHFYCLDCEYPGLVKTLENSGLDPNDIGNVNKALLLIGAPTLPTPGTE